MEISLIYMRIIFCTFDDFSVERFHTTLLPPCTKTKKKAGHVARFQTIPLGDEPFSCVKITLTTSSVKTPTITS